MEIPDRDELVKLVSQQTIGETDGQTVEKWTLEVWSSHPIRARRRARRWTRQKVPNARNIFNPETPGTQQSTLSELFTELGEPVYRTVEVIVVKPFSVE